jgi:hypothetical protein
MILDHCRDTEEFKRLYESRPMPSQYDFEWLLGNPNLFCFYDETEGFLRGFITVQREGKELTLSGTSIKKNLPDNVDAINMVCNAFNENMYAYTPLKHAALCLKMAGFEHVKDDKYVRLKNG